MRKLLLSLLLTGSTAVPALAAPDDPSGGFHARDERHEARTEAREQRQQMRAEGREAGQGAAAPSLDTPKPETVELRARSSDGPAQAEAAGRAHGRDIEAIRAAREVRRDSAAAARALRMGGGLQIGGGSAIVQGEQQWGGAPAIERERIVRERPHPGAKLVLAPGGRRSGGSGHVASDGGGSEIAAGEPAGGGTLRQSDRPLPRVLRNRLPGVSSSPQEGSEPPLRLEGRRGSHTRWSGDWRRDRRYDWWSWRNRHRTLFRLGHYYDPFGWSYRRHSIGWRLWPTYYSSRYWLHDPWQYRLPYAPPGYRWIRYYDDAILIDTWDGRVADVIYNFFW